MYVTILKVNCRGKITLCLYLIDSNKFLYVVFELSLVKHAVTSAKITASVIPLRDVTEGPSSYILSMVLSMAENKVVTLTIHSSLDL